MLTTADKRRYVREKLLYVRDQCLRLSERETDCSASTGLVAHAGIGVHSGRLSDFTASNAISGAMTDQIDRSGRAWFRLVTDVYVQLAAKDGKSMQEAEHDRLLAWVLHERIFGGKKGVQIVGQYDRVERCMNEGMVSRYYGEVVDLCVDRAESRGMI